MNIPPPLYTQKKIKEKFADIQISDKQRKVANKWLRKLKNKELEKEKENYDIFEELILKELLGYPEKYINDREKKHVEFSVRDVQGVTHVCFEAKGTKTKDLFAYQDYGKKDMENPVIQTITDMARFGALYGVCTNYRGFVLLDRECGLTKCYVFDFYSIKNNEDKLKEFIGVFSYQKLVLEKTLVTLYRSSVTEEKDFTKEFYKLFHETRMMMIKAFHEKEEVGEEEATHYAQVFLNRLIFIFFQEDKGQIDDRLFTERVLKILDAGQCTEFSKSVSDDIINLFKVLDKGSDILGIFGFNGGLFEKQIPPKIFFYDLKDPDFFKDVRQHSKFSKMMKLDEFSSRVLKKYEGKLNPIISNLLLMDSFDFRSEINVNILGRIFEQSISDLEKLGERKNSRRKEEGVYYTPEYITDFICKNTIIPYLSKKGVTTVDKLILEYDKNIEELEKRIKEIKILDPACGSGAFLLKAVEILLEIDEKIHGRKPHAMTQRGMKEWSYEKEIIKIIENNIFGVDVNEESVEITKLSLFLKMITVEKKLIDLSKNIRVGNSLISDKSIDDKAFDWEHEFEDVLNSGKFDVIIGNPPYIQLSMENKVEPNEKEYLIKKFGSSMGRLNTFGFFTRLGINLLKNYGMLGFIIPNTILTQDYYEGLREMILNSCKIEAIVNFSNLPFKDAVVENIILILRKTSSEKERMENKVTVLGVNDRLNFVQQNKIHQKIFSENRKKIFSIFWDKDMRLLKEKIEADSSPLVKFFNINQAIALKYDRSKYIGKEKKDETYKMVIDGREINRYSLTWSGYYLKYDINAIHSCKREDIFISSEKLFFRRVGDRLIATSDDKKFYALNTLVVMNKKLETKTSILYFLGIFNSRLMNYYYVTFLKSTKKIFSEIQARQVENLPIKILDDNTQKNMLTVVDNMLSLNKQLSEMKDKKANERHQIEEEIIRTDKEIDELVYNIYNITKDEKKIIEKSLTS